MEEAHQPFRYSARVDSSEANTSHAIVLDLVGSGKRVLDLGCATGYLSEALTAQGNKVSGVEIDAEAAEAARPFLDRLVIGDVEQLDLVAELGAGEFDVLVFADVLEHVKDPVAVLRRCRPLLAEGGFVVVSIPNVAHGSVRLALLKGRFEYRPTGLLDESHLRFFTRDHVKEMLADAGFVAVDSRQTTAGPFETEIPLERAAYPADVVAQVEADPESWVYQFVARAEPVDAMEGEPGQALADQMLEVQRLRRTLASIAVAAGRGPTQPVVGVFDPSTEPEGEGAALAALRMAVTVLELRRRLAGYLLRQYTLAPRPVVSELGDDVTESLAPWGEHSAAALKAGLDAVVVLPGPVPEASARALAEMEEAGIPVHRLEVGADRPDPLVLARRLADRAMLDHRREYLAVTGQAPSSEPYVLRLARTPAGVQDGGSGRRAVVAPTRPLLPIDLLALVDSADVVVTSSEAVTAVAQGLGRPVVTDEVPKDGWEDPAADADAGSQQAAVLSSLADRAFDELHHAVIDTTGNRLAQTVAQRLEWLERRAATLEAVNAGLRQTLSRERFVMASEVRRREGAPAGDETPWSSFHADRMARELAAAQGEIARLHEEIHRIYATRTMRAIAPARKVYSGARRLFRRS